MANHLNRSKRWALCAPEEIGGRKLWVARRNSGIPEIWVHVSPYLKHFAYFKGTSLLEGTEEDNRAFLASLIAEDLAGLKPMPPELEKLWNTDMEGQRVADALEAKELAIEAEGIW